MKEMSKSGLIGGAAMKDGMDRKTARKYRDAGKLPSELTPVGRDWRTRADPFAKHWPEIETQLTETPVLEVKTLFEALQAKYPDGWLKRRLMQALMLRGHRDFDTVADWQAFVDEVVRKVNAGRGPRLKEELAVMRQVNVEKLPEFVEESIRVSSWSTIRVRRCAYSVASRLIGHSLKVRVFENRIEAYYQGVIQLACDRLIGRDKHQIDYRHIIWSLVQKPGGFSRYIYREEMFPSLAFRKAYEAIQVVNSGIKGDVEYLRILHLAASTMESTVETAPYLLLENHGEVTVEAVKALATPDTPATEVPNMAPMQAELSGYDSLLCGGGEAAA